MIKRLGIQVSSESLAKWCISRGKMERFQWDTNDHRGGDLPLSASPTNIKMRSINGSDCDWDLITFEVF